MKKIIRICTVIMLLASLLLCACGKKQEESANAPKQESAETPATGQIQPAQSTNQPEQNANQPELSPLTDAEKEMILRALYVFPTYTTSLPDKDRSGWILDSLLVFDKMDPELGISYIEGQDASPIDIDYMVINAGDICSYYGVQTADFEKLVSDFYGQPYSLPVGSLNYDTCINDGEKCVEWTYSYIVSYETYELEITLTDNYVEDNKQVLLVEIKEGILMDSTTITRGKLVFHKNESSRFGYSLEEYTKLSEEHIEYTDDLETDVADDYDYDYADPVPTREEITAEETRIRNAVNSGAAVKVELKAGTDNVPYGRWYCYENGTLVFAYYYNRPNAADMRMYFQNGLMIELIEGSSEADRVRTYLSDYPDGQWGDIEEEVKNAALAYAP